MASLQTRDGRADTGPLRPRPARGNPIELLADVGRFLLVALLLTAVLVTAWWPSPMRRTPATQPGGTAILTWKAPALNEDGSALADLAAFKVYWGTAPGTYSQSTKIASATARSYTVSGLTKGTWYFVVTALNSKGLESPYSNVWSKTVP